MTPEEHVPQSGPDLTAIREHFRGYTAGAGKDVLDLCDAHEALIAALRKIEWADEGDVPTCLFCGGAKYSFEQEVVFMGSRASHHIEGGHAANCELGALLPPEPQREPQ